MDLALSSSVQQLKYTKYLKMTQLMKFQYGQLFHKHWNCNKRFGKVLAKLLSPLSQLEYTIKNTKQYIEQIGMKQVPHDYKIVSFDIKPLFTNIPLGKTIEITLERIYEHKEMNT